MSIKVMSWYWDHSDLDGHQLLAMLALADWSNDEGECFPSMRRLAQRVRREPRTLQRTVRQLEEDGELLIYPGQGRGASGRKSPLYYLLKYREDVHIETPPMIVEAAHHYRATDRRHGQQGRRVRTMQAKLTATDPGVTPASPPTGDAHVAPTGDAHVAPTGDAHVAPTGDAHVALIHHIDPSYRSVSGSSDPPPPLGSNDVHHQMVDGGAHHHSPHCTQSSNDTSTQTLPTTSVSQLEQATTLAMRNLSLALVADNLPAWNTPERHVDQCAGVDLHNLLGWLWMLERIRQAEVANPYSIEAYDAVGAVEQYTAALTGINDLAAYIISRTGGGRNPQRAAAPLTDADVQMLASAIRNHAQEMEQSHEYP